MKIEWNKKYTTIAVYVCIVMIIGVLIAFCAFNLGKIWSVISRILTILNPIIYGFVIAFLLNPMYRLFERRVFAFVSKKKKRDRLRRVLSLIAAYLVAVLLISSFILIVVPQIVTGYSELEGKMSGYVATTQAWVEKTLENLNGARGKAGIFKLIDVNKIIESINEFISGSYKLLSDAVPYVKDFITMFINVVKNMFIGLIISVYFLYSRDKLCAQIKKSVYAIFSKDRADRLVDLTRFTSDKFEGFIVGKIIDSIIIGVLTFAVLAVFDMPYPALIAMIIGVTNIIPFFGPFIGAVPSAFIIFVSTDPSKTLLFILLIIIIQQLDGNIIGPLILGDRTGLSALWIVVSLLLMGGMIGITGMFIGVPLFAVLYALFSDFVAKRLSARGLPVETDDYIRHPEDEPPKHKSGRPKAIQKIVDLFAAIRRRIASRKNRASKKGEENDFDPESKD